MSNNNQSRFYRKAQKIWSHVVRKDPGDLKELQSEIEQHRRMLTIFQSGRSYSYVFNIFKSVFDIKSDSVQSVLGYSPNQISVGFFIGLIHPRDKSYFLRFEKCITQFFKALDFGQIEKYKVQYDFRIKTKDNGYIRVLHQVVQTEYDKENFYRCLDLDTDITHIKPKGVPVFSLIGFDGEPSYFNIQNTDTLIPSQDPFTKREREILKMIVEGQSSDVIAQHLSLSLRTINTHEKSILTKAEVNTPDELVYKVIKEGWL